MKLIDTPTADNLPAYREPPLSGNTTNGLGATSKSRARRVFHCLGEPDFAWSGMNVFFLMNNNWQILTTALKYRWLLRRANGPIAKRRHDFADAAAAARAVKAKAKELGAGIVGIAQLQDDDWYEDIEPDYDYAVCMGAPMRREALRRIPDTAAAAEVQRAYGEVAGLAIRLAEYIRSLGWPAVAYADPRSTELLQIPMAVRAGLGELGKHGSLICKEYGSNFRLSSVVTTLPLAVDAPVDIGVDDLCIGCRRCTIDCPPDAIFDEKQWVRGDKKWYVDFDKCVPYFSATYGCGICIEVCPWSEPGRGSKLSEKLLAKRAQRAK